MPNTMSDRAATPPTTPPAMAPTGAGEEAGTGVGDWVTVVVARLVVAEEVPVVVVVGAMGKDVVRREDVEKTKGL
jgi:hypothetical protein